MPVLWLKQEHFFIRIKMYIIGKIFVNPFVEEEDVLRGKEFQPTVRDKASQKLRCK